MKTILSAFLVVVFLCSSYGQQRFTKYVSTVQALKNLNTADIYRAVHALGYYSEGDGGGGIFVWNSASTTATNLGTMFKGKTTGAELATGRWERVLRVGVALRPEMFGGIANDSALDDAAFAGALTGASEVQAGPGRYELSGTISLGNRKKLVGIGETTLRHVATNCGVIKVVATAQNFHIENVLLTKGTGSVGTWGIEFGGDNKRWTIKRTTFGSFNIAGIYSPVGDISYGTISECFFFNNSNDATVGGTGLGLAAGILTTNLWSAITTQNSWFTDNDIAVWHRGGAAGIGGVKYSGNSIEGSGKKAIGSSSTMIFEVGSNITLDGNYIEANKNPVGGAAILFDRVSAFSVAGGLDGLDIGGVLFGESGIIAIGREGRTGSAGTVSGVYFNNVSTNGYFIAATNITVEVVGSRFDFGGVDATDATLAERLSGSVIVRGRGTPGPNNVLAMDASGKLETFIEAPVIGAKTLGAAGDGVTDDSAALYTAITNAASRVATLDLMGRTYMVSTLALDRPVTIQNGTIKERALYTNTAGFVSVTSSNITLRNVNIDGASLALRGLRLNPGAFNFQFSGGTIANFSQPSGLDLQAAAVIIDWDTSGNFDGGWIVSNVVAVANGVVGSDEYGVSRGILMVRATGSESPRWNFNNGTVAKIYSTGSHPSEDADGVSIHYYNEKDVPVSFNNVHFNETRKRALKIMANGVKYNIRITNPGDGTNYTMHAGVSQYGGNFEGTIDIPASAFAYGVEIVNNGNPISDGVIKFSKIGYGTNSTSSAVMVGIKVGGADSVHNVHLIGNIITNALMGIHFAGGVTNYSAVANTIQASEEGIMDGNRYSGDATYTTNQLGVYSANVIYGTPSFASIRLKRTANVTLGQNSVPVSSPIYFDNGYALTVLAGNQWNQTLLSSKADTFTVDDLAYNAGTWNGSTNVPTRNAVRDEMELKLTKENTTIGSVTRAQRDALTPANGLIVYQSDSTPGIRFYENGAWVRPTVSADP